MSTQKFNASAKQPASRLDPPDTGESRGATYDEQQRRIAEYKDTLARLYSGELNSGLVFTCQIRDFPEEMFQVTEFDLQEGLSELFSLSIVAVSALPDIDFQTILGRMSSLTVKRDGKKIREVQGLLASIENLNTDGVKTWYRLVIRPEMWVMALKQDSRIFQRTTVPKILDTLLRGSAYSQRQIVVSS